MATSLSAASLRFASLPPPPLPSAKTRAIPVRAATASSAPMDPAAPLLRAAKYTMDKYVSNGMVIGLGSGLASSMAIKYLGHQLRSGELEHITGIAALQGEESIIQEKSILTAAKKLVFMITESKYKGILEGSVPVLVNSLNWMDTAEEIDDLFLGDAEVWRRPSIGHADPHGGDYPLITKEGHNVLDVIFTSPITSLAEVAESLNKIDGVVDHGIISSIPCTAVVASESGIQVIHNVAAEAVRNPAT